MLILQNISYIHPNKDLLFDNINLSVNRHDKVALIGNNGTGKSTLLSIIAGKLMPSAGQFNVATEPYYVPQIFGQYNDLTIAQALRIDAKLEALKEILDGNVTENNLSLLNDDWTIEERCSEALSYWQLTDLELTQKMETLSGGQKTKVFLAGVAIHQPEFILLDEPSNHLDTAGRQLLYNFIRSTSSTLMIVSHDRELLNLLDVVCELSKRGITVYGGNYDFYAMQKQIENNALNQDVKSKEKAFRKAKEKERETLERQQKLDARGKKKQEKAGIATIMMNTLRNNAERSTAKIKNVHAEKIGGISQELHELRSALPDIDKMKFGFDNSALHKGKVLFRATDINFQYNSQLLWKENLNIQISSGERISLKGLNGSGKTTLIKIILGKLDPQVGEVYRADNKSVYIDQDYSLIDNALKVYDQTQQFNLTRLQEHEIKIRLNRFLFTKEYWDKPCSALSGGEKMRLMLCCLTISNQSPDIIILDEPTNNLDIQNIEILRNAINEYQGTLIVVSHDDYFLEEINIEGTVKL
ncbi:MULTISPECIES: ABC-F family ATP-binding cassette domain-containing protein [unclassified Arcicella]|uniref:ABC-F family ATP-binding cassette domain-containing protein n=1 Tax=unclassified Arcicella TaxID=2644986 RepID=UPI0028600E21|nr:MULTISPECIES: ABC-F family ATP-binding cassette domain-containing protein [unclassified Arcicella]MDR6563249.1 ATPase subunit of ABC transporter with duplicated ATPase domains [Arcicella sp. BE51]MDR6811600.1 ATPase subunit of ABC transporter with duplicated ATPase domains [Arcicella sp. BE140]MDR6823126.1 ATPase subunit of ABC transporter with duplicated ATPase domains [Arcicella sp. BE139]